MDIGTGIAIAGMWVAFSYICRGSAWGWPGWLWFWMLVGFTVACWPFADVTFRGVLPVLS